MKYFICTLGRENPAETQSGQSSNDETIQLGIPTNHTEKIIPVTRIQTVDHETKDEEISVSLPVLFLQKSAATPHGVVLRSDCTPKTVLLTPGIERDLDIAEESIHQLPGIFTGLSRYFKGVYFDNKNLILLLNTEKFGEGIK